MATHLDWLTHKAACKAPDVWRALQVELLLWDGPKGGQPETMPMQQDVKGTWSMRVCFPLGMLAYEGSSFSCCADHSIVSYVDSALLTVCCVTLSRMILV